MRNTGAGAGEMAPWAKRLAAYAQGPEFGSPAGKPKLGVVARACRSSLEGGDGHILGGFLGQPVYPKQRVWGSEMRLCLKTQGGR